MFMMIYGLLNLYFFSGEAAFHQMREYYAYAKNPMIRRFQTLRKDVPITVLYGEKSWIRKIPDEIFKEKRPESYVKIHVGIFFV